MGGSATQEIAKRRDRKGRGSDRVGVPACKPAGNSGAKRIGAGIAIPGWLIRSGRADEEAGLLRTSELVGTDAVADAWRTVRAERSLGGLQQQKRG